MADSLKNAYAPPDPAFDRTFATIAFSLLIMITLATSYVHYAHPGIFRVPSNTDISSWQHPPFEDTCLYEQMRESERQTFLEQGVPLGDNLWFQFGVDFFTLFLGWLVFLHSRKHCGFWMSTCFLIGSFVFTGLEESMFIILGRFIPPGTVNLFGEPITGTYWFTKGGLWFFECPVQACVAWYIIAYSCVLTAGRVFPNRSLLFRAAAGGLIAMTLDLWMDPVVTTPEIVSWVWSKGGPLMFFGIPDTNFVGWFNLIFLFAIFWEKLPKLKERWGRAKASILFFLILIATEVAIAVFMVIYSTLVGILLLGLGYTEPLMIPAGW